MNRKDFRPSNNSSSISDKDKKLIREQSNSKIARYKTEHGIAEVYSEKISGKEKYFVDVIENNKIKTLPESDNREQAQGKLVAYNNGSWNEKVSVEGDSSVGMPSYNGIITADYGSHYEIKDKDGNYDEVPKRFVHTEKDQKEMKEYYQRDILPNEKSKNAQNQIVYGTGTNSYVVTSHSRNDKYGKSTIIVKADNKNQIKKDLMQNGMIADSINKE